MLNSDFQHHRATHEAANSSPGARPSWFLGLIAALTLTAGCASTMPVHIDQMTPEQIAAYAKIKDASVMCIIANTPYGKGTAVFVNVDKGVVPNGILTVDDQCKVSVTNTTAPKVTP